MKKSVCDKQPHWLYALQIPKYRICKFGISDRHDLYKRIKELEKDWGKIPLGKSYFVILDEGQNSLLEGAIHSFTNDHKVKDIPQKSGWTEMRDNICWDSTINGINSTLKPYGKQLQIIGELIRDEYRYEPSKEEIIEEEIIEEEIIEEEIIEEEIIEEETEIIKSDELKRYRIKNTHHLTAKGEKRTYDAIIEAKYDLWDISKQLVKIKSGSKISEVETDSLKQVGYWRDRKELVENGIIDENWILQEDYECSRSGALSIIIGTPASPTSRKYSIEEIE